MHKALLNTFVLFCTLNNNLKMTSRKVSLYLRGKKHCKYFHDRVHETTKYTMIINLVIKNFTVTGQNMSVI